MFIYLVLRDLVLTVGNHSLDGARGLAVYGAADRHAGAEDLLASASKSGGHRAGAHDAGDADEVVLGDVAVVLDVLLLLLVTDGLVEGLDDKCGGAGDNLDGGLTVLHDELAGDAETLPVLGGLGDIITDLLGVETKRTDLGGKGCTGGGFTTDDLDEDLLLFVGVYFGRHVLNNLSVRGKVFLGLFNLKIKYILKKRKERKKEKRKIIKKKNKEKKNEENKIFFMCYCKKILSVIRHLLRHKI